MKNLILGSYEKQTAWILTCSGSNYLDKTNLIAARDERKEPLSGPLVGHASAGYYNSL